MGTRQNARRTNNGSVRRTSDVGIAVENVHIYEYYRERLINMALAQFEWHGLPDTIDVRYLEKTLFYNGSVCFYQPTGTDIWLGTSWVQKGGLFDVYGYPQDVYGIDFNGNNIETDDWELIYDNRSRTALLGKIELYAKLLYETHQTFRSNLMQQNTPYIVATSKNELLSVKNLFARLFQFDPVIEVREGFSGQSIDQAVKTLDTRVDFKGKEILETRRELWADALSMLGITSETTKKERLIQDEIAINRQEDTISLNARLLNRVEFCNKMNKLHGWKLSVNLSEIAVGLPTASTDVITESEPDA